MQIYISSRMCVLVCTPVYVLTNVQLLKSSEATATSRAPLFQPGGGGLARGDEKHLTWLVSIPVRIIFSREADGVVVSTKQKLSSAEKQMVCGREFALQCNSRESAHTAHRIVISRSCANMFTQSYQLSPYEASHIAFSNVSQARAQLAQLSGKLGEAEALYIAHGCPEEAVRMYQVCRTWRTK